jgi:indole-3-glycerol phosphate synthase
MADLVVRRFHREREGYVRCNSPIPASILEKIVWHKELEVNTDRYDGGANSFPVRDLIGSLKASNYRPALIAEVKQQSPSKGILREDFDPVLIAQAYEEGGAAAISVLTDRDFFGGSFENLALIRQRVSLPLLCKEFIIDRVQLDWARSFGADGVLLIVAILSDRDLEDFCGYAQELGMQVLIEVHSLEELKRILSLEKVLESLKQGKGLVGVNNRDLRDFRVDLQTTIDVIGKVEEDLRSGLFWVSESGLFTRGDLDVVEGAGAQAVLVGESLVRQPDIAQAVRQLLNP